MVKANDTHPLHDSFLGAMSKINIGLQQQAFVVEEAYVWPAYNAADTAWR